MLQCMVLCIFRLFTYLKPSFPIIYRKLISFIIAFFLWFLRSPTWCVPLLVAVSLLVLSLYHSEMAFEGSYWSIGGPQQSIWSSRSSLSLVRLIRRSFFIYVSCENTLSRCPLDKDRQNNSSTTPKTLLHCLVSAQLKTFHHTTL